MKTLTIEHIYEALAAWTGIPPERLRAGGIDLAAIESSRNRLADAIVGQDEAINSTVRALGRRARLAPRPGERRPLWSALFAGPSGVGKSQLAKELARAFFGDVERHLIRIDLSDFRDEHTVARLVGAPPGYKGHGDGGELTNALRRMPDGLILLDEVEKAHPALVTQILIPLLGEAVVHDMNDGRAMDVSQFVVVMTSNLGAGRERSSAAGFASVAGDPETARQIRQAISEFFPNEILGRIDDVVIFSSLTQAAARQIWDREVVSLVARLSTAGQSIDVQIDDDVTERLLGGSLPSINVQGVRAIRKLFDRMITNRCLELLGDCNEPGCVLVEQADGNNLRYRWAAGIIAP